MAQTVSLDDLRATFEAPLGDVGEPPERVIEELARHADPGTVATTGPRFLGFVIGGTVPASIGADWLVSAWDQNSGLYAVAPAVSVIEDVTATWLLDLLDLPSDASVGFVTGCQMANCTALAAARNEVLHRVGWNVEAKGLRGAPRVDVVIAEEAHATIHTSLRLLGLGAETPKRVPCDEQGRILPDALESVLALLDGPTIVCAQAGNVNSGAFDPLDRVVEIAHRYGAWVHVDGAFGLWAAVSPRHAHLLAGHRGADSWSTDAHKWPNVPYDCGAVIVADSVAHRRAMSIDASYLVKVGAARDPLDWVPEFSRRARAVPLYAALRSLGRRGVRELVERGCDNARLAAELLARDERVEILNEVVLNQVLMRFSAGDHAAADLSAEVVRRVLDEGVCWLGGTRWKGESALRFSVANWSTTASDVGAAVGSVRRALDEATGGA